MAFFPVILAWGPENMGHLVEMIFHLLLKVVDWNGKQKVHYPRTTLCLVCVFPTMPAPFNGPTSPHDTREATGRRVSIDAEQQPGSASGRIFSAHGSRIRREALAARARFGGYIADATHDRDNA
jgi:hypothetical protein